jgi:hypothetical protein
MSPDERKRIDRRDLLFASALIAAGIVISALSVIELASQDPQRLAQVTQPTQSPQQSPPDVRNKPPAESKPGGERPTTPAPEPVRPDAEAQKTGAQPVLPPAPAEKTAPPINEK